MSRRRKITKSTAQRLHAKRRAKQRYGLELKREDLAAIARQIQSGHSTCVAKQSVRVTIHRLEWQGTYFEVVYDRERKNVVTFLPLEPPLEPPQPPAE